MVYLLCWLCLAQALCLLLRSDLQHNQLTGEIPKELDSLSKLLNL